MRASRLFPGTQFKGLSICQQAIKEERKHAHMLDTIRVSYGFGPFQLVSSIDSRDS